MINRLSELIELVKRLPESCLDATINSIKVLIDGAVQNKPIPQCPHCKSSQVKRYGFKASHQRYRCKSCNKIFSERTNSIMAHSHFGEAAWRQVIYDTVHGYPIKTTSKELGISEDTVFRMRHKILLALEDNENRAPKKLHGICELDDTYVLESYKGSKLPKDCNRGPRKHGAVAKLRGISNEHVC